MDRRDFLHSAPLVVAGGIGEFAPGRVDAAGDAGPAHAGGPPSSTDIAVRIRNRPVTKRWAEQRWVLDNVIQANGVDWDQPRSIYLNAACGIGANADFLTIRQRVKKFADIASEFEAIARRRSARARAEEAAGELVSARESYFMAATYWGAAQWPIFEANEQNRVYNENKRNCYTQYAKLADHHVEAVWIPVGGQKIPGWLHLPPGYNGGRIPVVVSVPGMDSFKEMSVALYGDPLLARGFAVLAIDGPGQYECPLLGVYMTMEAWANTGQACMNWLLDRPEIDPARVAMMGRSFGSLVATIAASKEPRYRAVAVVATCIEPGFRTLFEEASPTFKMRFMFMSNFTDEAAFDTFCERLTWEGYAEHIRMPYLCLAGQSDEVCPLENAENLFRTLPGPRRLVIYEGSRHSVGGVPSAILGPPVTSLIADWLAARFKGDAFATERWFVDGAGQVTKTAL
jgi:pimeloyl-ACP methyl ester carboxylesterase